MGEKQAQETQVKREQEHDRRVRSEWSRSGGPGGQWSVRGEWGRSWGGGGGAGR